MATATPRTPSRDAAARPRRRPWKGLTGWVKRHPGRVRGLALAATFFVAFVAGLAYGSWALVCRDKRCPSIEVLENYTPRQTSKLYAADGRFVAEVGLERRTLIKLGDIPKIVRDAFVVTEDKRFYGHAGIDWIRVFGALVKDIQTLSWSEGFSTIPMQLARNVFPEEISREKNLVRKLKEAKVARAIEAKYSKDKILELYLNQISLGNGAFGVETAAQRYFGKSARALNLAEAATLAALPKGPERYNPRRAPDRAIQRRNLIVELMRREEVISDSEANLAKAYPLKLAPRTESDQVAPYFVEWVRHQLDQRFGDKLYEQGLKVYTTLDLDLQRAAERALERQLKRIEGGTYGSYPHLSYERYIARASGDDTPGKASPYLQGAFVAMDPRTGAVRALIGGRDFDDSKFNRATQALRQPGSTFKPVVFAAAIQAGRAPATILDDSPLTVQLPASEAWTPRNYDGRFEGPIALRRALYESRNLATIRLGMELGEPTVTEMARRFGITTRIPPYPSIHIGSADVYPIEMIASYTAFANLGVRTAAVGVVRVENQNGEVLWEPGTARAAVMSPEEAWLMVDVMKDVVRRGTASGGVWGAGFQHPSAGKTGTTNDGTDVWYIGYTADLVAGVWMGFDMPRRIKANAQGGQLAAPAYTAFMTEAYRRRQPPADWPRPEGIVVREVDVTTGLLATPYCPREVVATDYFISGTDPGRECEEHVGASPYPPPIRDTSMFPPRDTSSPFSVPPRPTAPPLPRDSAYPRLPRDTAFPRPPRDSMRPRLPGDTMLLPVRPRDTARPVRPPRDTLLPIRPRPDTPVVVPPIRPAR